MTLPESQATFSDPKWPLNFINVSSKLKHDNFSSNVHNMVPTSYEDAVKSSVIIPSSLDVLERSPDKYNLNNNNSSSSNANHIGLTSPSSTAVALKIEEVSNETSNLMLEDRQNTATSSTSTAASTTNSERSANSKPPYSYVALIAMAIANSHSKQLI